MASNTQLKFKKKSYNSSTDSVAGVVVFDTAAKKIFLEGDSFSGDYLPSQGGNTGKFLKTDGSSASWSVVDYNDLSNKPTLLTAVVRTWTSE